MPRHTNNTKKWRVGVQGYLGGLFIILLIFSGLALGVVGYRVVTADIADAVEQQFDDIARTVNRDIIGTVIYPVRSLVDISAQGPLGYALTLEERLRMLPVLHSMLRNVPVINGIFLGYENGEFFHVGMLRTEEERRLFKAPPGCVLMVCTSQHTLSDQAEILYFDDTLQLLERRPDEPLTNYDPRNRSWYKEAMNTDGPMEVGLHSLMNVRWAGMIFSRKSRSGWAVMGMSVTLKRLSRILADELPTPGAQLALLQHDGTPLASSSGKSAVSNEHPNLYMPENLSPVMRLGVEHHMKGTHENHIPVRVDGRDWLLYTDEIRFGNLNPIFLSLAIPNNELMANANKLIYHLLFCLLGCLLFFAPLVWLATRSIAHPLRAMAIHAKGINGVQNDSAGDSSRLAEIDALSQGVGRLERKQNKLLAILRIIGSERDFSKLIERVLQETVTLGEADGGGLALLDAQGEISGEGFYYWSGDMVRVTTIPCEPPQGSGFAGVAAQALAQEEAFQQSIPRDDARSSLDPLRQGFANPAVERVDLVWVALRDRKGAPLGLISLMRAVSAEGNSFSPEQVELAKALAAGAGIVLETQRLFKAQRDLRDAFIQVLAGAIDAKSPHTGGHCERVPVIFQMLLQAACDTQEGPLANFTLDEDGWEAARQAGWLHDCGKVTTPEYVMDKATKLETMYDRIHEVRTRFEVLKRDAEIAFWKAAAEGADMETERQKLHTAHRELDDDFAFVASCNLGTEAMDAAAVERLTAIGRRVWTRTLDKQMGVSRDERGRMDKAAVPPPPVIEPLLSDNPEHVIPRTAEDLLPPDNPWSFRLTMPEALYNRGELYNLSIRYGTLTPEERYKINDHITQTIIMLERMPLPNELAAVPEIAGAHHETMDGKGYPRRLTRDEMSWPARMMAVADIFEALTAWDRPYKNSKTLSEALQIMDEFKKRSHIDPDVYDLFLHAGIPRRYAAEYLRVEQNDLGDTSLSAECQNVVYPPGNRDAEGFLPRAV